VSDSYAVGCSDLSPLKWERLAYHLSVHIPICGAIINKSSWVHPHYHYIDLYAGPGIYAADRWPDMAGMRGSPLIALEKLREFGLSHSCVFVEPRWGDFLRKSLVDAGFAERAGDVLDLHCREAVERLIERFALVRNRRFYGLVFVDPNGYPRYDSLRELASIHPFQTMDFLIHVNATANKRCLASPNHPETIRPTEHLRSLGKKFIYLWTPGPGCRNNFTLAHLTNWDRFPQFRPLGFYKIDSAEGERIAFKIDYNETERKARAGSPGFLPGID
jgi:hypothetical protein